MTGGDDIAQPSGSDLPGTFIGHDGYDEVLKKHYTDYWDWDHRRMRRWYKGDRSPRDIPNR